MPHEKRPSSLTQVFPASKGGSVRSRLSGDAKKRKVDSDATKTSSKRRRTEADRLTITAGVGSDWDTKDADEAAKRKPSSRASKNGSKANGKAGKGKRAKKGDGLAAVALKGASLKLSKQKALKENKKQRIRKPKKVVALKISRKGRKAGKVSEKDAPEVQEEDPSTATEEEEEEEVLKASAPSKRTYLEEASYDGETFKVGDSAYVVMDPDKFDWEAEEEEVCQVCGAAEGDTLLECDRCLLGFHLNCLKPPLKEVPKGSWLCPGCCAGKAPSSRQAQSTAREKFLAPKPELEMLRVEAIWRLPDGTVEFVGRWYIRPESTLTGRQPHHGSRELFLSNQTDINNIQFLLRPALVPMTRSNFEGLYNEGDDVFLCEYEYDESFHRFRRCSERERTDVDEDWDWEALLSGDEESEADDDEDFDEAAEKRRQSRGFKGRGRKPSSAPAAKTPGRKRQKQGGGIIQQRDEAGEEEEGDVESPGGAGPSRSGSKPSVVQPPSAKGGKQKGGRKRASSIYNQPRMPLAMAKAALALSARPRELPCREREKGQVGEFLEEALQTGPSGSGHCLYVSGVPGTGKTATCLEVVRQLQRRVGLGDLPGFRFVEINGLRLPTPHHAYSRLYEALTGEQVAPTRAAELLESHFSNGAGSKKGKSNKSNKNNKNNKSILTVVLLDEMDLMVTRRQSVLYSFFDWPMRPGANLAVIGIANTMDLPERLLPRIASRLGQRRVQFMPYNSGQIKEIIESRLRALPAFGRSSNGSGNGMFEDNAMEFVSKKVASVSGDCRRALEICRRAADIAETQQRRSNNDAAAAAAAAKQAAASSRGRGRKSSSAAAAEAPAAPAASSGLVEIRHVNLAIKEMFNSTHIQLMKGLARADKMFLGMLLLVTHATGRADSSLLEVANRYADMTSTAPGERVPDLSLLVAVAARLGANRLLITEPASGRWRMRMALNVPAEDVVYILKEDTSFQWMHRLLNACTM